MRKLTLVTITLIAVFMSFSAYANTWYVSPTGDDTNPGDSWANAKATIQAGIDAASDGDTILVADGIYTGDGNRDIDFFGKAITVRSANGPESTIIDCQGTLGDPHRGFNFHSGESATSVVDGFTIKNGYAPLEFLFGGLHSVGGAIYCYQSSPTIENNIICNNRTREIGGTDYGGGVYVHECSPTIENNIIENNQAVLGGGIYNYQSQSSIKNNLVVSNSAWEAGGGIYCNDSSPKITNCTISENTAAYSGGGIGIRSLYNSSSPTIQNCTITDNTAEYDGGGIYCRDSSSPTITNTILWNNSPMTRSIWSANVTYSDVQGGWEGEGNIDADPKFVDAYEGDYHLLDYSPCIGTGTSEGAPETDIEGNLRPNPVGSNPDMGAYENTLGEPVLINPPVDISVSSPTNLTLSFTPEKDKGVINLSWEAPEDEDVTSYNVYRSTSTFEEISNLTPIATDIQKTEYQDILTESSNYYYAVTAIDALGNESDISNICYVNGHIPNDIESHEIPNSGYPETAYIVNALAETISIFNIETQEVKNDILAVGQHPDDIKIYKDRGYVILDHNIQVIDLNTNSTIGTIPTGDETGPGKDVADALERMDFINESEAYVTCRWTNSVKRVDLDAMSAGENIQVGTAPWGIVVTEGKAYVCNTNAVYEGQGTTWGQGTVSVIDTKTDSVIKTIEVGTNPTEIATDLNGNVLVLCKGNFVDIMAELYIIDSFSDTVADTLSFDTTPVHIAVAPSGIAYLKSWDKLISVDLSTRMVNVSRHAPGGYGALTVDTDGNVYICVPDWEAAGRDKLVIVGDRNLAGTYQVGKGAQSVAIRYAYINKRPEGASPLAVVKSVKPADGSIVLGNISIIVEFDNPVESVTIAGKGAELTAGGKKAEIKDAGLEEGRQTVGIRWINKDGSGDSRFITYTVKAPPDTKPPKVVSSTLKDGATGVVPDDVNADGIVLEFNEEIDSVALQLSTEGTSLRWAASWDEAKVTLLPLPGGEVSYRKEYVVSGTVTDTAGNEAEIGITFITTIEHTWLDINSDGEVNIFDLVFVGKHFGEEGDEIVGDVNKDGVVNISDLVMVGSHFGEEAAPSLHNITLLQQIYDMLKTLPNPNDNLKLALKELEKLLVPKETVLLQNYPNPFNPETWIPFKLSDDANVVISIYDISGQRVRKIGLGKMPAGMYVDKNKAVYWDGCNQSGERVSSGLYFYKLQAGDYSATKRMLILK